MLQPLYYLVQTHGDEAENDDRGYYKIQSKENDCGNDKTGRSAITSSRFVIGRGRRSLSAR